MPRAENKWIVSLFKELTPTDIRTRRQIVTPDDLDYELVIRFEDEDDVKILSLLKYLKMPDGLSLIGIWGISKTCYKDPQLFFRDSFPNQLNGFWFTANKISEIS